MSWSLWSTLIAAGVLISMTPGAGAINTMANSLGIGWRRSIWGILGQQIALVTHIVIVAAGLGILVAGSPVLFNLIRYVGAAYLVFLGVRQWRSHARLVNGGPSTSRAESRLAMVRRALLVNLTNPKGAIFFLALVPQLIRADRALLPQYLVLTVTIVVVDILIMWGFFATAAKGLRRLPRSAPGQHAMNKVFGGLFVGVGILLVTIH
ncbi:MAG: LysE family transporter [Allobranchiibius sp.]